VLSAVPESVTVQAAAEPLPRVVGEQETEPTDKGATNETAALCVLPL